MGQKISQLTALSTTYADTDLLEVSVDTGGGTFVTRKMTFLQLRTAFTKLQANIDVNSFQITSASNGNIIIRPNGSGAVLVGGNSSQATELRFMEDSDNGTNYVALKVADALAASTTYTLPTADGTTGQVLSTNGSGVLSWATASGGGGITVGTTAVTSGTVGRIFFQGTGDVVQQDSTLFWDNTNKRLGVGATPSTSVRLDVRAQGALSTDVALRVRNSADTRDFLVVNGAGDVFNRGAGGVSTNTFFGENSGRSATGGTNTFFGANAGESNTTAIQNTFIGEQAGNKTTTGNSNTFVGKAAGFNNTTGILNCIFGRETGYSNTTGGSNSFFGSEAGFSNTTASANSFFGSEAGRSNTTGFHNTFVGSESGKANTTASYNSFFGRGAGVSNTTGQQNTFVGNNAAYANTTGSFNTAVGRENATNTTGSYNNFFGVGAGNLVSGGGNNTVTNNSIYIGYDTRANASSETNQIVIGHEAIGLGSNTAVLGNTSIVTTQLRGSVISGNQAALATTATDGFLYIPSCAGAPTGTPTAITGKVPMVADTTNNKLYIYVGGAWTAMN